MLSQARTGALRGIEAIPVVAEVNIASGLPTFTIVGLPQGAVREGRERVVAALRNAGFDFPNRRVTVNLAPADVRKEGTGFDLPVAIAILAASGAVDLAGIANAGFLGELGLDGGLRPVRGVLPVALSCRDAGLTRLIVPTENAAEAGVVEGLDVWGLESLTDVVDALSGRSTPTPVRIDGRALLDSAPESDLDLSDVRGHLVAKRALTIAAAGAHNLLFIGPPGAGKTMLARRLATILPPATLEESFEITRVHSVAGLVSGSGLVRGRPFRAPHHTISYAGLVGGGTPLRPGEVSLAHHGVLFFDELPEFRRSILEVMRQPLEDGHVHVVRAGQSHLFPTRFIFTGAMNPCPCGFSGDGSDRCCCEPHVIRRYLGKISGPVRDRIDMHVVVPAVPVEDLQGGGGGEESAEIRARVTSARELQQRRLADRRGVFANGHMSARDTMRLCSPDYDVSRMLYRAVRTLGLSPRAYHRVLKVARTIADLEGAESIEERHVAEALQYRVMDGG